MHAKLALPERHYHAHSSSAFVPEQPRRARDSLLQSSPLRAAKLGEHGIATEAEVHVDPIAA